MTTAATYLTLTEVAAKAPGRPHASCVWRWCRKGVKARNGERIRLTHIRMGGQIFVPDGGLEEFAKALADADAVHFAEPPAPPRVPRSRTAAQRERAIAEAKETLKAAGAL